MGTEQTPIFTLYRGWPTPDEIVWSPFVTKVELRLRLAGVIYNAEGGSTAQSPKGKIPYINVNYGIKDDTFSDSTLIVKRLAGEGHLPDINAKLSPAQKLEDLAIRSLLEEKLYFYHMYERWIVNYYAHRDYILGHMSIPMRSIVGMMIYRSIKATLHGQGTGRFSDEEIEMYRHEIWQTIENQLVVAKQKANDANLFWILGGEEATEADCTLFGFISSILIAKSCPRSQEVVRSFPTVMEYANRIFKQYFSTYRHWDT